MYILNEVCYLTTSIAAIHFLRSRVIISQEHLKRSICQGHCVCFTTLVATTHYKKLPALLEVLIHLGAVMHEMLNARKYSQPRHSLLVYVLIYNFATVIVAIH